MDHLGTSSNQSTYNRIPILTRRKGLDVVVLHALVDEHWWMPCMQLAPWRLHTNGYAVSNKDGVCVLMHRYVMGVVDPNIHVHHKDGIKIHNYTDNLLVLSKAEHHHLENRCLRTQTGKQTKYAGVTFNRATKRWRAFVYHLRRQIYIGTFDSDLEAAAAYNNFVTTAGIQRALNDLSK